MSRIYISLKLHDGSMVINCGGSLSDCIEKFEKIKNNLINKISPYVYYKIEDYKNCKLRLISGKSKIIRMEWVNNEI